MLVGAAIVATRFAVGEVPPLTLAMLRYTIGVACLVPFAWNGFAPMVQSKAVPVRMTRAADFAVMAALGIGQFALLIAFMNYGLKHVAAAQAALIFSLFPLLTLLLSALLGREHITWTLTLGVLLSIAGVALALAPKLGTAAPGHWWGELAVGASALTGAVCSVLYRPYLQRYPTLPVSTFAMLASVLVLAVLALSEQWPSHVAAFSGQAWAAMFFIGLASAVGYVWWLYALKHESPTRVTVFLALNPITAALLGWMLLGEAVHPASFAALGLIAVGLWLATRPAR